MDILLQNKANLEHKNIDGLTALATASFHGHTEIVRMLLANGATFDTVDKEGNSPLHHAASQEHEDTMQYLVTALIPRHGTLETILH